MKNPLSFGRAPGKAQEPTPLPESALGSVLPDGKRIIAELTGSPRHEGYEDVEGVRYGLMHLGTISDKAGFSVESHLMTETYCAKLLGELYEMYVGFSPLPPALADGQPAPFLTARGQA